MTNPKLALIPSGYKGGTIPTVYSILPSDGSGDFTFDRASEGTRVRKDGLIEEVSNDVPRLDWSDGNCPSLLLEQQRTNYATNNTSIDTYSNSVFGNNPNPTQTADYTIAPDGTLTATRLQTSKTGTNYSVISFPTTSDDGSGGGYYTASVYVKSNTGNSQSIAFYGANSAPNNRTATTEWSRIQFTGQRVGNTKYAYLGTFNGTDDDIDISVWGAQIELVDSYPSSLIYTGASPVTRLKDECLNGGNADLFNVSELSWFIDVTNFANPLNNFCFITITDGQSSPINMIRFEFETTRIIITVYDNGTFELGYNITSVTANQRNKLLLTFDGNEAKIYFNGVLKNTSTNVAIPTGIDSLSFTNRTENGRNFEGKVHDTRVYDRVLTEAEAIELTTL